MSRSDQQSASIYTLYILWSFSRDPESFNSHGVDSWSNSKRAELETARLLVIGSVHREEDFFFIIFIFFFLFFFFLVGWVVYIVNSSVPACSSHRSLIMLWHNYLDIIQQMFESAYLGDLKGLKIPLLCRWSQPRSNLAPSLSHPPVLFSSALAPSLRPHPFFSERR